MICNLCKKQINDFIVKIELKVAAERLTSAETWEQIPNSKLHVAEVLCKDCFDRFAETMSKIARMS